MSKTTTMNVEIRFGDCDPAGIVFFPRYHRWMDAASLNFFMTCGVPPWHVLEHSTGIIDTPLLEHHARFVKSATYGERLTIATQVLEWRAKVFLQKHSVTRDDELICESTECAGPAPHPGDPGSRGHPPVVRVKSWRAEAAVSRAWRLQREPGRSGSAAKVAEGLGVRASQSSSASTCSVSSAANSAARRLTSASLEFLPTWA